jgi:hypothetical protein
VTFFEWKSLRILEEIAVVSNLSDLSRSRKTSLSNHLADIVLQGLTGSLVNSIKGFVVKYYEVNS